MNRTRLWALALMLGAAMLWMVGCEMPWESDDDDDPVGTSTIQGKISDFVAAPKSAKAALIDGIEVFLAGPVSRSTTTGADGIFIFSGLPAGAYRLRFRYNGEEVRYRGNSGQEAEISLSENQRVELTGVRISGGVVNIGNIKFVNLTPVSTPKGDSNADSTEATNTPTTSAAPTPTGTVSMTVNVNRK